MNARLAGVLRFLKRVLSWLTGLSLAVVVAGCLLAYLAASGKSLPVLRALTTRVGQLMAGQRTEKLALQVRVMPREGRLAGTATLTVRSLDDKRQRFYFLLNDGLHLQDVRAGGASG